MAQKLFKYLIKINKNICPLKYLYKNVHNILIYNSQSMKKPKISIKGKLEQLDKR